MDLAYPVRRLWSDIAASWAMISVVIAAYDEERTIGATLDALLMDARPGEFDIVVVANGCRDNTAGEARRRPVTVIEVPKPGKAAALNIGDAGAATFPRLYLDADTPLSAGAVRELAAACQDPGVLAASPARWVRTDSRPLAIRCYYAINNRLPVYSRTLFGRGAIMVTCQGRSRFEKFPSVVADDLFLDSQFGPDEKRVIAGVNTRVDAPATVSELLRRLTRVRAGNRELVRAGGAGVVRSSRLSWMQDVVLRRPYLLPAGVVYAALTIRAEQLARRGSRHNGWNEPPWSA